MSKPLTAARLALLFAVACSTATAQLNDLFSRFSADLQGETAAPRGLADIAALPDGFYLETVARGLQAPVTAITTPAAGAVVLSGQTVTLAGTGTNVDPG